MRKTDLNTGSELSVVQQKLSALRQAIADGRPDSLTMVDMLLRDTQRRVAAERQLADARTWMDLAQEAGGIATYRMDLVAHCLWWSNSVFRLYGLDDTSSEPTVDLWLSLIHPDDREAVEQTARAAIDRGAPVDHQFRVITPSGEIRWIHDRGRVDVDSHGRPLSLHGVNVDVTAVRRAQEALAQSEERFRRTFEHANVGVAHVALDGSFIRVNDWLCNLLGRDEATLTALSFQDITHPEDLETDLDLVRQVLAGERASYTLEKRYLRPDGETVWADLSVSLLRDRAGVPLNFVSVVTDSRERKMAQDQLQLVLAEANHRVKNLLTVVSAIVTNSARTADTVQDLGRAISLRLQGIAASHDLLMGKSDVGGDLAQLILRQLDIFTDCAVERVTLVGPPVSLSPQAVHAFGMVLHELATNACKYGALSGEAGQVEVRWSHNAANDALVFTWQEIGGPPVQQLQTRGFGTVALRRMLAGVLGGTATHELPPEGARFSAIVPMAKLCGQSKSG